jgi:hypothetical protein
MAGPLTGAKVDAAQGISTHMWLFTQQFIFNPAAAAAATIVAAVEPSAAGIAKTLTIAASPDYPRALSMTVTDANSSITSIDVQIWGTDFWGVPTTDTIRKLTLGTGTVDGNVAFRTVGAAIATVRSGTVTGGADTISIGITKKFGLKVKISATTDVKRILEGELEGGSGAAVDAMAVDAATLSTVYHTFDPVVAPNAVKDYILDMQSTYASV